MIGYRYNFYSILKKKKKRHVFSWYNASVISKKETREITHEETKAFKHMQMKFYLSLFKFV